MTDSSGAAEATADVSLAALDAAVATVAQAQQDSELHLPAEVLESADITKMSDAQIADFESGDPERVHAALTKKHGEDGPSRVSIKALKPEDRARTVQALDLIRAGTAPADAFAEVFGISALPPAVAAAVSEPVHEEAEAEADVPQVADLENHLAYLKQQYRAAKESYDPAATDLLEEMTDVKMELREARREQAAVNQSWMSDQAESHARAMEQYGHMITDPNSNFLPFCDDEIVLAEARNDPILNQPDWPEKIGQRVMDKFFRGQAAYSPNLMRGLSQIPPVPRQSVRLPGSPVGPGFSAGSLSPQTALAELDKLTPEQQDAFIQSLDHLTSRHPRH